MSYTTITDFAKDHAIGFSYVKIFANPYMDDGDNMNHYQVRLEAPSRGEFVCFYSKGSSLTKRDRYGRIVPEPPNVAEVLECLRLDADALDCSFEDWADSLGYDRDSRSAECTYRICAEQGEKLRRFLGDLWPEFLECEEC